jgi:hypothetical protein
MGDCSSGIRQLIFRAPSGPCLLSSQITIHKTFILDEGTASGMLMRELNETDGFLQ